MKCTRVVIAIIGMAFVAGYLITSELYSAIGLAVLFATIALTIWYSKSDSSDENEPETIRRESTVVWIRNENQGKKYDLPPADTEVLVPFAKFIAGGGRPDSDNKAGLQTRSQYNRAVELAIRLGWVRWIDGNNHRLGLDMTRAGGLAAGTFLERSK